MLNNNNKIIEEDKIRKQQILEVLDKDFVILRWNEKTNDWRHDLEYIYINRLEEISILKEKIKEVILNE